MDYVVASTRKRILALVEIHSANFMHADWLRLSTVTSCRDTINPPRRRFDLGFEPNISAVAINNGALVELENAQYCPN